ncbi:hypothetical protein dsx2_2200 [Desulfovibrio sp. X2]|uniref:hypothetical protein n=1 Tax=Desulfovibrio sp. X2 TaxID=941449 RepID=UPI000358D881|nr:hypothetical protein [Desulfovibrio sp. X2]EPR43583.1 hypothetical protein dsx2_2200 [Desulfovibrio sp. X2]
MQPIIRPEELHVPTTIELRAFMGLSDLFRERGWDFPLKIEVPGRMSGCELLERLEIPEEFVEVIFVNGKASKPDTAVIDAGDRVALAPPGVPGPYRVLLGFKKMD